MVFPLIAMRKKKVSINSNLEQMQENKLRVYYLLWLGFTNNDLEGSSMSVADSRLISEAHEGDNHFATFMEGEELEVIR